MKIFLRNISDCWIILLDYPVIPPNHPLIKRGTKGRALGKWGITKEFLNMMTLIQVTPPTPPVNPSRPPLKLRGGEGGVMSEGGEGVRRI